MKRSGRKRKKLLTLDQLSEAAEEIAASSRHVAAAGGYAMQVYGSDRLTADLDVVALRMPWLPRLEKLSFGGYSTVTSSPSKIPIDVIVRTDDYAKLYQDAVKMARLIRGVPIAVVRKSHLAAMKMVAGRGKDELDLVFLLGTMTAAERAETRKVVKKFLGAYALRDLDNRILEAEWKRARGIE